VRWRWPPLNFVRIALAGERREAHQFQQLDHPIDLFFLSLDAVEMRTGRPTISTTFMRGFMRRVGS